MTKFSGSFLEFVRSWRYFIWMIVLGLALALFYVEEDWRGHWSWQRYQRRMHSQGQHLDPAAFIPSRVPDDKNFTMTPFLAPLFDFIPGSQKWAGPNPGQSVSGFAPKYDAASHEVSKVKTDRFSSWIRPRTDLAAWYLAFQKANQDPSNHNLSLSTNFTRQSAATGVLKELLECGAVLDEIQAASQLPYSRFNLRYEEDNPSGILLPHLGVVKHLCQVLSLRACARLATGEVDQAFSDVKLMLFLTETSQKEPFLISQLVRMAEVYLALQPIAEGLGQWSDSQLSEVQQKLAHFDLLTDTKRNLEAERSWGCAIIDYVARSSQKYNLGNITGQPQTDFAGVLMTAAPEGWLELEKLHYCRIFQESILPAIDLENHRISPAGVEAKRKAMPNSSWTGAYFRHRFFTKLLLPATDTFFRKAAFGQTAVETAMLACALERYRKVHGRLPQSLEALTPDFVRTLPHDVITGQPLKYRLTNDNHYLLYSVGWNETDNGGVVSASQSGDRKDEFQDIASEEGDWVWQLPPILE
jgi:hypothetical protein